MKNSSLYLGVDGGASKTNAVLVDKDKKVLATGDSAGSNATVFGQKEAVNRVYSAIQQVLTSQSQKIIGTLAIAGINTEEDKKSWQVAIKEDSRFTLFAKPPLIINDIVAALRSGTTEKNAIAIIAGTGSSCYGRNDKGEEAKSGGVDYILSDQGGGYDIGLKILKNVTKSLDGRGEKTVLTDLLFEKLKINSLSSLQKLVYQKPWDKADIASISPLVEAATEKNDQVALKIIDEAVNDLSLMIKAVATHLNLTDKPFDIVTTGSVFNLKKLGDDLEKEVKKFSPNAKFVDQNVDSATAAAYLAIESE